MLELMLLNECLLYYSSVIMVFCVNGTVHLLYVSGKDDDSHSLNHLCYRGCQHMLKT